MAEPNLFFYHEKIGDGVVVTSVYDGPTTLFPFAQHRCDYLVRKDEEDVMIHPPYVEVQPIVLGGQFE